VLIFWQPVIPRLNQFLLSIYPLPSPIGAFVFPRLLSFPALFACFWRFIGLARDVFPVGRRFLFLWLSFLRFLVLILFLVLPFLGFWRRFDRLGGFFLCFVCRFERQWGLISTFSPQSAFPTPPTPSSSLLSQLKHVFSVLSVPQFTHLWSIFIVFQSLFLRASAFFGGFGLECPILTFDTRVWPFIFLFLGVFFRNGLVEWPIWVIPSHLWLFGSLFPPPSTSLMLSWLILLFHPVLTSTFSAPRASCILFQPPFSSLPLLITRF